MAKAPDPLNAAFGTFGKGRYGWVLRDVNPLPKPVPVKGAMGLWNLPPGVEEAVLAEAGMSVGVVWWTLAGKRRAKGWTTGDSYG
jgi:hypothetical protein